MSEMSLMIEVYSKAKRILLHYILMLFWNLKVGWSKRKEMTKIRHCSVVVKKLKALNISIKQLEALPNINITVLNSFSRSEQNISIMDIFTLLISPFLNLKGTEFNSKAEKSLASVGSVLKTQSNKLSDTALSIQAWPDLIDASGHSKIHIKNFKIGSTFILQLCMGIIEKYQGIFILRLIFMRIKLVIRGTHFQVLSLVEMNLPSLHIFFSQCFCR